MNYIIYRFNLNDSFINFNDLLKVLKKISPQHKALLSADEINVVPSHNAFGKYA